MAHSSIEILCSSGNEVTTVIYKDMRFGYKALDQKDCILFMRHVKFKTSNPKHIG